MGIDGSPHDTLSHGRLKDAAKIVLRAARSWGKPKTPIKPMVWRTKILVLLDVDGALLPFGSHRQMDRASLTLLDFYDPSRTEATRFYYNPAVIEVIKTWASTPDVQVAWLTSWGELAADLAAQLGLPDFQSLIYPQQRGPCFPAPVEAPGGLRICQRIHLAGPPNALTLAGR